MSPVPEAAITAAMIEVKTLLRIAGGDDDAAIARAAASAIALGEAFLGCALIERAQVATLPATTRWQRLPACPVRTIGAVSGLPADGAAFVLPIGSYALDIDAAGDGWVRVLQPGAAGRVSVHYGAGLASGWSDLPEPVREGAVRLATHLIGVRGSESAPPAAVTALWRPYRRMRLMPTEHAA